VAPGALIALVRYETDSDLEDRERERVVNLLCTIACLDTAVEKKTSVNPLQRTNGSRVDTRSSWSAGIVCQAWKDNCANLLQHSVFTLDSFANLSLDTTVFFTEILACPPGVQIECLAELLAKALLVFLWADFEILGRYLAGLSDVRCRVYVRHMISSSYH
jgi:hypothetical protein